MKLVSHRSGKLGKGTCPVAEDAAARVLTLPTYYGLPLDAVRAIAQDVLEIVDGANAV